MVITSLQRNLLFVATIFFISIGWAYIFHFAHPIPSSLYYEIFFLQFIIPFLCFPFSMKWGRVSVVVLSVISSRLGIFIFGDSRLPIMLVGIFCGAIAGIYLHIFLYYSKLSPFVLDVHQRFLYFKSILDRSHPLHLGMSIFFAILLLDRFVAYFGLFGFSFWNIQQISFTEKFSSLQAFSYSIDILAGLALPTLYFYVESQTFTEGKENDYSLGILIAFIIQLFVILVQTYIFIHFANEGTNFAAGFGRASGLFRDAGSASVLYPILLMFSCHWVIQRYIHKFSYQLGVILLFLFLAFISGGKLGRGYWVVFFFSFVIYFAYFWKKHQKEFTEISIVIQIFLLLFIPIAILVYLYIAETNLARLFVGISHMKDFSLSSLESLDPPRFFLNKAAWDFFLQNPLSGVGVGGFQVVLSDPSLFYANPLHILDNPGSLYLGLLVELGILGFFVVSIVCLYSVYSQRNYFVFSVFLVAGLFGYHIVHPDTAFIMLLFIGGPLFQVRLEKDFRLYFLNWIILVISGLFLINTILTGLREKSPPEFRFWKLGKYQLSAFITDQTYRLGGKDIEHHNFRGKIIWKLNGKEIIPLEAFLDEKTSKKITYVRWSLLDKNFRSIQQIDRIIGKDSIDRVEVQTAGSSYLQLQELDLKGNPKTFPDTIVSIPKDRFTNLNEYGN
jgi:hypothetical protein